MMIQVQKKREDTVKLKPNTRLHLDSRLNPLNQTVLVYISLLLTVSALTVAALLAIPALLSIATTLPAVATTRVVAAS